MTNVNHFLCARPLPMSFAPKKLFGLRSWVCTHASDARGARGKEPACQCRRRKRRRFSPWVRKVPWRRARQPTPVFLPGESHGQRSLEGYGPQGCPELDTTEATYTHTWVWRYCYFHCSDFTDEKIWGLERKLPTFAGSEWKYFGFEHTWFYSTSFP